MNSHTRQQGMPAANLPAASSPSSLHEKAADNLRYIRSTMESATSFTGVSGKGYVAAGLTACGAAWLAALQTSQGAWLAVWMLELLLAGSMTLALTVLKEKNQGGSLWSSNGRKLLLAFIPAMTVGAVLTLSFSLQGNIAWLPGIWLSIYGAAVMTAGAHSVAVIPVMGGLFILLGALALLTPLPPNLLLGLGMGGLHIVFGFIVWRNHGG